MFTFQEVNFVLVNLEINTLKISSQNPENVHPFDPVIDHAEIIELSMHITHDPVFNKSYFNMLIHNSGHRSETLFSRLC